MSSKLHKIPHFNTYDDIRVEMQNDLQYRLANRTDETSLGRPLYYRINVQLILTQECPYNCPFCLERKNPMQGENDFTAQIESLKKILSEHPNARLTITGGGTQQIKVCESQIVAMRGRNPDNPSDRTTGSPTEQRLEVNMQGTSNCLTSVQKDNLLLEKPQYRIRKLTPRECGRLMGVSDEDIDKMTAVNSNTQLYKQFGNSIVVDVMCAMFKNLNINQGDTV